MAAGFSLAGTPYDHFEGCRRAIKKAIYAHGDVCYLCGAKVTPDNVNLDHVIPTSRGGIHAVENWRATHPACNTRKGDMLLGGYMSSYEEGE
jgi:5-methylcytosine-specific restriction endonuclease McrA